MQKEKATQQSSLKNSHPNNNRFCPRLCRLALALLEQPRTVRELADVIPTNNPAEYVRRLRQDFGLTIPCEHIRFTTIDQVASWYGEYSLTSADCQKLREALGV